LKFAGNGDFRHAWGGISGLQVALPAVWGAASARGLGLEKVLGWMCRATADLVGLRDRGRIEPSARADLVAFAPAPLVRVAAQRLLHRNPVSAFDGAHVRGAVRRTWLAGRPVTGAAGRPAGRLLARA
jgi:allantoinase